MNQDANACRNKKDANPPVHNSTRDSKNSFLLRRSGMMIRESARYAQRQMQMQMQKGRKKETNKQKRVQECPKKTPKETPTHAEVT